MFNKISHLKRDFNPWSLFTITMGIFVALPLFAIVVYLFLGYGAMWQHIVDYFLFDYLSNSLLLLLGTGILCFLFGTSTAWLTANYEFPARKWIEWMLYLPLSIPSYIMAYTYVGLWGNGGLFIRFLNDFGLPIKPIDCMNIYGLIWILSCSLFPYVYVGTRAMFLSLPKEIKESSSILGVSNWRHFYAVALPLASPAIIGGLFLVFMEVLNDYGAAKYYGIQTFTTGIFRSWTMLEDLQSAIYLSAILIVLVFVLSNMIHWQRGQRSFVVKGASSNSVKVDRIKLRGPLSSLCLLTCCIPLLFGFVLPMVQLVYWASFNLHSLFETDLWWIAFQSISLAISSTFIILTTALALIFCARWNPIKSLHVFKKMATVGYVIPGAIIGIGITRSSQAIIHFFDYYFQVKIGYLFYGSSFVLVYAYLFRFLAVAYKPLASNSLKIGLQLAESSYLLGISKLKTLFSIELPLLRSAILGTLLIVLIDVLKELPLTLILKPYHVQTLAVKAYAYAEDEQIAKSALPALLLIVMIMMMMMMVQFIQSNSNKKRTLKPTN